MGYSKFKREIIIKDMFKAIDLDKLSLNFLGTTPPDIFVGRYNYPNVFTGILSGFGHDDEANKLSSPESWFKEKLNMDEIIAQRSKLLYSRFSSNVKNPKGKLADIMQEISMTQKMHDVEIFLKKKPFVKLELDTKTPPLCNFAPLVKAKMTENIKIDKKIDYVVDDYDLKAVNAIMNLYNYGYDVSSIIKLFAAGLLGVKEQRRLVPSRWSTTAVDSIISSELINKIKNYDWVNDILLFQDEFLGNHYEILLLPNHWSYEVIEMNTEGGCWIDYENVNGRKTYADSVVGAYYSCRLSAAEYLSKVKRQASVLIFREIRPEYYTSVGVGILRELSRNVFRNKPVRCNNLEEAFSLMNKRLLLNVNSFVKKSKLLREFREQKKLVMFG